EGRLAHRLLQGLNETVLSGNRRALGPDDRQRQPGSVVALEAWPKSRAEERRFAGTRRAQDDQHAFDAGADETADLVEATYDLRVAREEDGRVLLLKKRETRIGPASGLEGKARRIEAATPQTFLEPPVGVGVTDQVDPLLGIQVRRHLGLINSNQRDDN